MIKIESDKNRKTKGYYLLCKIDQNIWEDPHITFHFSKKSWEIDITDKATEAHEGK